MNQAFMPEYNKGIHEHIINNFRENQYNSTSTHLPSKYAFSPSREPFYNGSNVAAALFHASTEANGINNTIDLTTGALPVPANLMGMLPNNFASLMNNITGTTVERSSTSNKSLRKKKKES